jgi:hypothetical protein
MAGPLSNTRVSAGAFTVTVSGEPRLCETVRLLTHKAAEADGCVARDAARLAEAVYGVVGAVLEARPGALSDRGLDVRFEPDADALGVEIVVPPRVVAASNSGLEGLLAASGALERLRAIVPDVEFGRSADGLSCRLRCSRAPRRAPDR